MARFAAKKTSKPGADFVNETYEHGYSFGTQDYSFQADKGLNVEVVKQISAMKNEPAWMLNNRLQGFAEFEQKRNPLWGADLTGLTFADLSYYLKPTDNQAKSWEDVPPEVKETFDRIGVPEAEREYLAGVKAQYDSEVVYGSLKKTWEKDGVIFLSMDEGLANYPDLIKEYFGKVIASGDNKYSALNTAVWSGGSFVYIPPGVHVKMPLQTYFRINSEAFGQFERTLIIVDEGASVHYVEGCTAPQFSSTSLHSAVVEIVIKKGATCQYTTVQNWYKNIYNLVTKRAYVHEEGKMVWTDFNMGSKVTMKYPGFVLAGKGAKGEVLSMALAGAGQHQDTGAKAVHLAPYTSSTIISKSISKSGGRASYRGMVHISPQAHHSKNTVVCDALLLDDLSRSDTYPIEKVFNNQVEIQHEATVSKIGDDQLFYLMSRGVSEEDARKMIVNGFIADLVKKLPLEYAVEMNRLIDFEMEGSIG
ncbi:MAG: Fe-S cluster assembly protein SufB [Candidatus Pacebacteria bacterium CG10_big_fil_rev_8_21_14_0_10_36_11]|nr:Fe-S cluster assembly protein SufB [Candidatus Pacearchaeota archaeon]OIP73745.1 MAG: Fe-S cluster assembly protein SufB [Candidatus Pacebacteria bacterium CG2_30_36_39]PIR64669.1 MAG: Fe-S cluster assembly protein SufB [Candidatus Pacebacteria bacterium CG10_big_fil_rev_8_21_14_0_10_36_11]PJC42738.1 MAG: Fe-S cluster assembly protein SufB [Candidatus Pacebacteria bacterium CG_4_9_14_0_2_um_filter_36_8]